MWKWKQLRQSVIAASEARTGPPIDGCRHLIAQHSNTALLALYIVLAFYMLTHMTYISASTAHMLIVHKQKAAI